MSGKGKAKRIKQVYPAETLYAGSETKGSTKFTDYSARTSATTDSQSNHANAGSNDKVNVARIHSHGNALAEISKSRTSNADDHVTSNGAFVGKTSLPTADTFSSQAEKPNHKALNFTSTQGHDKCDKSSKPAQSNSAMSRYDKKDDLTSTKRGHAEGKVLIGKQQVNSNLPPHLRFMAGREKMFNTASAKQNDAEKISTLKSKFQNNLPPHLRAILQAPSEKSKTVASVAKPANTTTDVTPFQVKDVATKAVKNNGADVIENIGKHDAAPTQVKDALTKTVKHNGADVVENIGKHDAAPIQVKDSLTKTVRHDEAHAVENVAKTEVAPIETKEVTVNKFMDSKAGEANDVLNSHVKSTEVRMTANSSTNDKAQEVLDTPMTHAAPVEAEETVATIIASKPENESVKQMGDADLKEMANEAKVAESMKETKLQVMPCDPDFTKGCQNLAIDEGFAARMVDATAKFDKRQSMTFNEQKAATIELLKRREQTIDMDSANLTQELASDEIKPSSVLARDPSENGAFQMKLKDSRFWRWFFTQSGSLDSAEVGEAVKKELRDQFDAGDGTMLPSSVEWDLREQFNYTSKPNVQRLEAWVESAVKKVQQEPFKVDMSTKEFRDGTQPTSGLRMDDATVIPKDNPNRIREMIYGPPWYPRTLPADDPWSQQAPKRDQTAATSSEKYQITRKERLQQQIEFNHEQDLNPYIATPDARELKYFDQPDPNKARPKNNPFAPKVDIFIRPANISDLSQIKDIYNYYVANTIHVSEKEPTDIQEWEYRFGEVEKADQPFLVAVLRNPRTAISHLRGPVEKNNRKRGRKPEVANQHTRRYVEEQQFYGEKIVGFSLIERFGQPKTAFDFTVELQLFVHHKYTQKRISKNLMDRMIPSMDQYYTTHSGTDLVLDRSHSRRKYECGGFSIVKKIVATLFYSSDKEATFKWQKENLEANWGFNQSSFMHNIAEKFEKPYHMAQFIRETRLINGCRSGWYHEHPNGIQNVINHI